MAPLTPDQELRVVDALVTLGWLDTQQGLHVEAVLAIRELQDCSSDDTVAILQDLRVRKVIEEESEVGAQTRFRWVRPATQQ